MRTDDVDTDYSGIEDRRGRGGRGGSGGGILGGGLSLPGGMGKGKGGVGALIVLAIMMFLGRGLLGGGGGADGAGIDVGDVLGQMGGNSSSGFTGDAPTETADGSKDAQYEFVADVRTLLNDYWETQFEGSDTAFQPAGLVVFDAPTPTGGCGTGMPEYGPFYCPADNRMYIDFTYYAKLERQLGFSGDFAMAYVIAHEYGHHVQNVLGINSQVRQAERGRSKAEVNALSVKMELQADCFAGAWAKSAFQDERLDATDFDEAMDAASAVGDDSIQGSNANQESFTHGTSGERQRWFRTGFDSGDPSRCDTFA